MGLKWLIKWFKYGFIGLLSPTYVRIDVPFEKCPLSQYERCYEKIKGMVSIVEVEIVGFLQFSNWPDFDQK